MTHKVSFVLIFYIVLLTTLTINNVDSIIDDDKNLEKNSSALAKLVKIFSKPGAFKQINTLLGEDLVNETSTSCPQGEDGLECRRAEARRSVDCPHGDCYCGNCSAAGAQMWSACCSQTLRCCSHLAAACRNCDQPVLYPFCSKHFKKCIKQINEKKQN